MVSILATCAAQRGRVVLCNAPQILETEILSELLVAAGASIHRAGGKLHVDCTGIERGDVNPGLSRQIHGSIYLVPALMAALGEVRFGGSGGDLIAGGPGGTRPVAHMLNVIGSFGGRFIERGAWLEGRAPKWQPASIDVMQFSERSDLLTGPLVSGVTKTAIIAAAGVAVAGATRILHPYPKPDVAEPVRYLRRSRDVSEALEAIIIGPASGTEQDSWIEWDLVPDLSEIMTYVTLAVVKRVSIRIEGVNASRVRSGLTAELELLTLMGVTLIWEESALVVQPPSSIRSVDIDVTSVGIYSDHQPFFALMLLLGDRPARIREQVWPKRFAYAPELCRLGARIDVGIGEIVVRPSVLKESLTPVMATDLRAAAVLALAACMTPGPVTVTGLDHLRRGYTSLLGTLSRMGADIRVLTTQAS
jgi:UDP-N-acetylglucosamine 1-carboxyvinyltransferase